ncbi:MAG: tetratricopeptide repeat protein [Anaerolineae bacterium]|jgi:soluble lytic murein transglycosylase
MHQGNYGSATETYRALLARPLDSVLDARSRLGLGTALLRDEAYPEAAEAFRDLRAEHRDSELAHDAAFLLGDALIGAGEPLSATQAYSGYLAAGTVITAYVNQSLGAAWYAEGVYTSSIEAYEAAIAEAPNLTFEVDAREKQALAHVALGEYDAALEQYDAILDVAVVPAYRARIGHQTAETLLLAGEIEAGYERHQAVVEAYPTEEHAYLSLVKLVEADRPVNDYLRGVVDYYGGAYGPAVAALYRYILAYPDTHSGDAHWYAGLSFIEAENTDLAVNEFELLIETHPAESRYWGEAWLKLGEVHADEGETDEALETYRAFVEAAPDHELAPEALWEAAQLLERSQEIEAAAGAYLDCREAYPDAEVAAPALLRSGLQFYRLDRLSEAAEAWETLAEDYPDSAYHPAAWLWLGKAHLAQGDREAAQAAFDQASTVAPEAYYGLRAAQLAVTPDAESFPPSAYRPRDDVNGRREAETWLADWLGVEAGEDLGELSPDLAADGRLQRGRELWRLGRFQQAKDELEALRRDTYSDALSQYQLALAYGDLGLYRSSILSAWRLIALSPVTRTVDAPPFIVQLAYPTPYEDLVLEKAAQTGLDPLLVFALIRQESLFESFAASSASAQGLMQVIPPTGAEIAAELDWPPDYETADLYCPYVSVRFGTYYLAKQRERFEGRIDAALAGYNGGPGNAQRWLERAGDDLDLFLETITFGETRLYLQRIREHYAVYRALYGE